VDIYRRALAYFLSSYLFLLTTWCALDDQGAGRPPLLLIGAPAGLALLTPPEPPLEFYASLEATRVASGPSGSNLVLVFSHPLNYQQEVAGLALQVLLYPVDRASLKAQAASLRQAGYAVSIDAVSRFACRLTLTAPGALAPVVPTTGGEGRGRSVALTFQAAGAASVAGETDTVAAERSAGRLQERSRRDLVPGLTLRNMSWYARSGAHSTLHVLELDPARAPVRVALGKGSPVMRSRNRLTDMARRAGAIAALNAGYFAMNGNPLGLLIDRGKVIVSPIYSRSSFGIHQQRRYLFGNPEFSGRVHLAGGDLVVATLNEKREDGKVVVYTPEFGNSTRTVSEGVEVAVARGRVVAVGERNVAIPPDGIVISSHGRVPALLDEADVGDGVSFDWGVTPPWNLCDIAVGGGPRLVKDGHLDINSAEERFDSRFSSVPAPRSAVGVTRDGRMILAAIDGRHPPANHGVTLQETARIMLELGCLQAMNLDGGGSTTMVAQGRVLNSPSDGREREISTGILIVPLDGALAKAPAPADADDDPVEE
jgi:uncharacterized protein YigE (DUF2233 family)